MKISDYSIVSNLLYDIVTIVPARQLFRWEKLFVVKSVGQDVHSDYLHDVYRACGCFDEMEKSDRVSANQCKIDDSCWLKGDLNAAAKVNALGFEGFLAHPSGLILMTGRSSGLLLPLEKRPL